MSALDRMIKERDRLLSEANKLTSAIDLIGKFKETSPIKEIAKPKAPAFRQTGMGVALKACAQEAIIHHGRPVTKEEILAFLPRKGFMLSQVKPKDFMTHLYPKFSGEGKGKRNSGIWYSDRPRPEKEEWKQELEKVV